MHLRALPWLLGAAFICPRPYLAAADHVDVEQAADEKSLKDAGVSTDGASLLQFFKTRTLNDAEFVRLQAAARSLGDDDFQVREKATADLGAAGPAVLPFLRTALLSGDPEVMYRARRCVAKLKRTSELGLLSSAARLLAVRRPPRTVETLLAYLPLADDEYVREAVHRTLAGVGLREGIPETALLTAAKDAQPARRVAAAYVLARANAAHRGALGPLVADADARVRLQAAAGLLRGGDKAAVPVLLALLTDGPRETAWQAEDLLGRIAADQSPAVSLGVGEDAARAECRRAWEGWWKANRESIDLARLGREAVTLGLTVICDCDIEGKHRAGTVWAIASDGKPRWQIKGVKNPADVQFLPGGRVLVAECQGFVVTERDRQGKILWSQGVDTYPVSCQRLANGNTFIATYSELLEVTRDGKKVYSHKKPVSIYCAQKLRNGHILYAHSSGAIVEMDANGRDLRRLNVGGLAAWASVEPLPNGRFLVAQYSSNRVIEIDAAGKTFWQCSVQTPAWATRLPNGNTLLASTEGHFVAEFDRSGKAVWKQETQGRPFRVRRY